MRRLYADVRRWFPLPRWRLQIGICFEQKSASAERECKILGRDKAARILNVTVCKVKVAKRVRNATDPYQCTYNLILEAPALPKKDTLERTCSLNSTPPFRFLGSVRILRHLKLDLFRMSHRETWWIYTSFEPRSVSSLVRRSVLFGLWDTISGITLASIFWLASHAACSPLRLCLLTFANVVPDWIAFVYPCDALRFPQKVRPTRCCF